METEVSRRGFIAIPFAGFFKRERNQDERLTEVEEDIDTMVTNVDANFKVTANALNGLDGRVDRIEEKIEKALA